MAEQDHRQCLNRLVSLSAEAEGVDHRQLAAEVDRVLVCTGRRGCASHLACSWLAADLATALSRRFR